VNSIFACGLRFSGLPGGLSLLLMSILPLAAAAAADPPPAENAKTCLLVIDVQDFYFPGGSLPLENPEAAGANCASLLKKFRDGKQLIVHVGHKAPKGASFHADVTPREGEKIVMKSEVSAFNGTDLLSYLRENGVGRLVICGMQTHMCVEGTVRAAHDLGFTCILVQDACATRALTWGGRTVAAADVHSSTLSTLDRTYATVVDTKTFLEKY
jgi:nicotinamidase-related amidase